MIRAFADAALDHARRVFIVGVLGFLLGLVGMQSWGWQYLRSISVSHAPSASVVATTPFDVILLQAKVGAIVGILAAAVAVLYYARDVLRERDVLPSSPIRAVGVALVGVGLFAGGVAYAHHVFLPLVFDFLAGFASDAGLAPTYGVVEWVGFAITVSLSLGLAAQLPLLIVGTSWTGVVPYSVWRDYWRHAVLAITVLGAVGSPPDPLSQFLFAAPLILLYVSSVAAAWFLADTEPDVDTEPTTVATDGGEDVVPGTFSPPELDSPISQSTIDDVLTVARVLRSRLLPISTAGVLGVVATFAALYYGGLGALQRDILRRGGLADASVNIVTLHPTEALILTVKLSAVAGVVAAGAVAAAYALPVLRRLERLDAVRGRGWTWVLAVAATFLVGVAVGYAFVAPEVLSFLVSDVRSSEMLVAWRVAPYVWLVLMLTIGVGGLAALPVVVVAAWRLGVPSDLVLRWRAVVLGTVLLGSLVGGLVEMLGLALVVTPAYAAGAAVVWAAS